MKFSERTNWNTEETELARAHRQRVEAGLPVADLTASNPTRCGFRYPGDLLDALRNPKALDYDPQPRGLVRAREAVCGYYADHGSMRSGAMVAPDQVILTTSTSEAYSYLFRLLCDPGSEILVPQPGYPLFDFLAALDDVRLKPAPLVYDHGWQIDPEGFRRAITPATRAIVIVHPNNPTGHFTKPWEARELAGLCRGHGLSLIVDEVFLDYALDPAAWLVATGPGRAAALDRLEVIADTFLSMNAPVQWAIPAWLAGRHGMQEQIRARAAANLAELDRQLAGHDPVRRLEVEGGWYAVLRIPAIGQDEATVRRLLDRGVWVHPGYFFGMARSGWLVVSLLTAECEFRTGVTTIFNSLGTDQEGNSTEGLV